MKVDRIITEIEKTKTKITELQARLRDLERQKTEVENTEILAVVRSANISQQELMEFIQAFKNEGTAAETMLENRDEQEEQEDFDNDED